MKKFLLALAAVLVLCVPAFAYDSNSFVSTVNASLSNNSTLYCDAPSGNAVFFAIVTGADQVTIYGISQTSGATVRAIYNNNDVQNKYCNWSVTGNSGSAYVADKVAYPTLASVSNSMSVYPLNTAMTTVVDDYLAWLVNPNPNPTPSILSSFTVPCGNVLYFQVSSEQDVTLSAQMPQLSYLVQFGGNAYGPWGDTGIEYGPAATLPSSGTTFPILSMDPIQWAKGEPRNILGQTKVGVVTKHCIVGQWYALFCPLTSPQVLDASTGDHAMGASVVVSGSFSQIKVYPLSETLDYDNPLGATYESGSNDGYDSYFDGSSDENGTVTWTNQDGQVQAPQSGGTNYVSPAANAESLLSQIRQLLASIVSELKSLFTFGYEAVQDLVGIMRDFANVLGGLYTWLPAEVYSALMSAVVVAIVIGVFKVFL